MGTPDFAVPSLEILLENGYDVVGVITSTDKMGGRGGKKLIESDVKKFAKSKGLNILQPKNLKAPAFIEELRALKADLQIIVAFRMLQKSFGICRLLALSICTAHYFRSIVALRLSIGQSLMASKKLA